jgi:peptide-methionine (S)-S-oxide reductase
MRGVVRCIVGYTGGTKLYPTYRNIQDHTEALLIEFNPNLISYEDLVIEWSRMHTPSRTTKCQYRSAVWYVNDEQQEIAEAIVGGMKATYGADGCTSSVERATKFYQAEEYHQNFNSKMMGGGERF